MSLPAWPHALGVPVVRGRLKQQAEDFQVTEELGFDPDGEGEHAFLYVEKREMNTPDAARQLARLAQRPERDVGYSGMKDRNAVTRQWFSVGLAGAPDPDWEQLESDGMRVLSCSRHRRKLRRGVHRRNRFSIRVRELGGDLDGLVSRLESVAEQGAPNYFGEQRFGRQGSNLRRARHWLLDGGKAPRRQQRSLCLSAARAYLFNSLLAERVRTGLWQLPSEGDVCLLAGTHSYFRFEAGDDEVVDRARRADVHLGLPLWGEGEQAASAEVQEAQRQLLAADEELCGALLKQGVALGYRPSRLLADDFSWEFCDDGSLQLNFALDRGSYATALVRELLEFNDGPLEGRESGSEQR